MELKDLTGMKFGRLTVIERAPDKILPSGRHSIMWKCKCECGRECIADGGSLRRGETKTCGCWKKPKPVHGIPNEWVKAPKPITIKDELVIGQIYTIGKRKLKLIGIFEEYARFEDENGFHECFRYFDLNRSIKK